MTTDDETRDHDEEPLCDSCAELQHLLLELGGLDDEDFVCVFANASAFRGLLVIGDMMRSLGDLVMAHGNGLDEAPPDSVEAKADEPSVKSPLN